MRGYHPRMLKTPRTFLPKVNEEFVQRDFGLQLMLQERPGYAAPVG